MRQKLALFPFRNPCAGLRSAVIADDSINACAPTDRWQTRSRRRLVLHRAAIAPVNTQPACRVRPSRVEGRCSWGTHACRRTPRPLGSRLPGSHATSRGSSGRYRYPQRSSRRCRPSAGWPPSERRCRGRQREWRKEPPIAGGAVVPIGSRPPLLLQCPARARRRERWRIGPSIARISHTSRLAGRLTDPCRVGANNRANYHAVHSRMWDGEAPRGGVCAALAGAGEASRRSGSLGCGEAAGVGSGGSRFPPG